MLRRWRESAVRLAALAAITTVVALGLPGVLKGLDVALPASRSTGSTGLGALTAPFALVDRSGLLASRLTNLPAELTAGGGTGYLGWSVIGLGLVAL